ncbi:hemolysin III [Flavobacteriaceae bacterium MAR_2010_188]|nr:hemolysin III [Flavobacteriaceae bacterium MAR_2010_188]
MGKIQSHFEETLNAWSHGIGVLLGIAGLVLLVIFTKNTIEWSLVSVIIYGVSIIVLFSASTIYHSTKHEKRKHIFRIIDHISIYLLIAGSYTPVLLITLPNSLGWTLFWVVWGFAVFGIVLKLFFTGRFEIFSTILYLLMGWLIVFDIVELSRIMDSAGLWLMSSGGIFYTVGIIFYAIEKIPYNHVIWHIFVLAGAICHFLMIFKYVI